MSSPIGRPRSSPSPYTWDGDLGIKSVSNYAYGMVRDGAAILAVATGGIIRSLDRGKTWRTWEGNLHTFDNVSRICRSGDGLYVWGKDGIIYRCRTMPVPSGTYSGELEAAMPRVPWMARSV